MHMPLRLALSLHVIIIIRGKTKHVLPNERHALHNSQNIAPLNAHIMQSCAPLLQNRAAIWALHISTVVGREKGYNS
jgi:hypothetical protein